MRDMGVGAIAGVGKAELDQDMLQDASAERQRSSNWKSGGRQKTGLQSGIIRRWRGVSRSENYMNQAVGRKEHTYVVEGILQIKECGCM